MCQDVFMKKANALQLRQNMGKVIKSLETTGEPILLEKNRKPVAVLISIEDYQTRFVDREADAARNELVERIKNTNLKNSDGKTTLELIRDLRS